MSDEPPRFDDFHAWITRQFAHRDKVEKIMQEGEKLRRSSSCSMVAQVTMCATYAVSTNWPHFARVGTVLFSLAMLVVFVLDMITLYRQQQRFKRAMDEWRAS